LRKPLPVKKDINHWNKWEMPTCGIGTLIVVSILSSQFKNQGNPSLLSGRVLITPWPFISKDGFRGVPLFLSQGDKHGRTI